MVIWPGYRAWERIAQLAWIATLFALPAPLARRWVNQGLVGRLRAVLRKWRP